MRSCVETVRKIIAEIPEGEPLRDDLTKFADGVFLELPEDSRRYWGQAAGIMHKHLSGTTRSAWQDKVTGIWFGESDSSD